MTVTVSRLARARLIFLNLCCSLHPGCIGEKKRPNFLVPHVLGMRLSCGSQSFTVFAISVSMQFLIFLFRLWNTTDLWRAGNIPGKWTDVFIMHGNMIVGL